MKGQFTVTMMEALRKFYEFGSKPVSAAFRKRVFSVAFVFTPVWIYLAARVLIIIANCESSHIQDYAWSDPREMSLAGGFFVISALAFLVVSARLTLSVICSAALIVLVYMGNDIKLSQLGMPINALDLNYLFDLERIKTLGQNYLNLKVLFVYALPIFLISLVLWRYDFKAGKFERFLALTATLLFLVFYINDGFAFTPSRDVTRTHPEAEGWRLLSTLPRVPFAAIASTMPFRSLQMPARVTNKNFALAPNVRLASGDLPDIVAVLNESLFNPASLAACQGQPKCQFPMFDSSQRLHVHVHGGGTWLSEFAFMSGMNWSDFGEAGMYAPYNLASKLRYPLPKQLRALGYNTVAIYPVGGGFVNARNAYKDYGFDEFVDGDQLNLHMLWQRTRDKLLYERASSVLRKATKPTFIFVVTIMNHGPHGSKDRLSFDPTSDGALTDYLGRLTYINEDTESFIADYLHSERKRLFMEFGDHQPFFNGMMKELPKVDGKLDDQFATFYRVRSNYSLPVKLNATDISYLGTVVAQEAGLRLGEYWDDNEALKAACHDIYKSCDPSLRLAYFSHTLYGLKAINQ